MGAFFLVAYIVIGIAQVWAGVEGMQLIFGIGGFLAVVLLLFAYAIPFVGTAAVAFLTYYGARYGWSWTWWQALTLAAPGIVLMLVVGVAGGLAIWAQRLRVLISVAPPSRNADGKDGQRAQNKTPPSKPAGRIGILRGLYAGGCALQTHVF